MTPIQQQLLQTARDLIDALEACFQEQVTEPLRQKPPVDLSTFNPQWKKGNRLSILGKEAMNQAFDASMLNKDIAVLFQVAPATVMWAYRTWKERHPRLR